MYDRILNKKFKQHHKFIFYMDKNHISKTVMENRIKEDKKLKK